MMIPYAEREDFRGYPHVQAFLRALRQNVGHGASVVDLGCLHGDIALALAREGFNVLGVEGRESNYIQCEALQRHFNLPNLRFIHADVRSYDAYGPHDAVLCCGLLYHLDQPATFLRNISGLTRKLLIVDTHYAVEHGPSRFNVSEVSTHDGVRGRWYQDNANDIWGSIGNSMSFWVMRRDLIGCMLDAGIDYAYEDLSSRFEMLMPEDNRSTFVGVKNAF